MPFIWDDYRWDFVDDEDEYDKKRFVVARKLFITASKDQLNDDESEVSISTFDSLKTIDLS